ncbi:MAG: rhodanese-like domain-containing protein [Bacteroidota bacterium]|nr:rhodanese-like domain-containing protein [Bacteroidota bacterium]MDP4229989.1 rhodanese-like domain-containing protein [Bacteroidota bacterium]MDP4235216.1 rhodanese-like domain-containing protein [Bacteroidota bacterium]
MTPFEISVEELKALLEEKQPVQLIDCREEDEYAICNIGGTLIPMQEMPRHLDDFDPDKPLVIMCHIGARSSMVAEYLRRNGYPNAQSLRGGIHAWSQRIDPKIKIY